MEKWNGRMGTRCVLEVEPLRPRDDNCHPPRPSPSTSVTIRSTFATSRQSSPRHASKALRLKKPSSSKPRRPTPLHESASPRKVPSFPFCFCCYKGRLLCIGSFGYVFLSPFALDLQPSIGLELRRVRIGERARGRQQMDTRDARRRP